MGESFSENEIKYYRKMFDLYDTDKSGSIGFPEIKNLSRRLGVELSDEILKDSILRIDQNGNGDLEFDEFLMWLESTSGSDEFAVLKAKITASGSSALSNKQIERLKEVFDHFDADGSGSIDAEELQNVFKSMDQDMTREEVDQMINSVDEDGSGQIEFEEFMLLMCSNFGGKPFEQEMVEEFEKRDPACTGLISSYDLVQMMHDLSGEGVLTKQEADNIVKSATMREDGYIEYMKWDSLWEACREQS